MQKGDVGTECGSGPAGTIGMRKSSQIRAMIFRMPARGVSEALGASSATQVRATHVSASAHIAETVDSKNLTRYRQGLQGNWWNKMMSNDTGLETCCLDLVFEVVRLRYSTCSLLSRLPEGRNGSPPSSIIG